MSRIYKKNTVEYTILEKELQYDFSNKDLLKLALTHPSNNIFNNNSNDYERLEFLGDSVIKFVLSEFIYKSYSKLTSGELSIVLSHLVNGNILSTIAKKISLNQYIIMSNSEENTGGRDKKKNLENCLEAIIGAIYLDSNNLSTLKNVCENLWENLLNKENINSLLVKDNKTLLQEYFQKNKQTPPKYILDNIEEYPNYHRFTVYIILNNSKIYGYGNTKKSAEQDVANKILKILNENDLKSKKL